MSEPLDQFGETLFNTEMAVRYILAHFPEARNNDKLLLLLYWELIDKIKIPREFRYAFLSRATPPETITRCRRRVQSSNRYPPSEEAVRRRRRLKDVFKEWSQQKLL
jgi:hypothetical protein